jgi:hypothetical protein
MNRNPLLDERYVAHTSIAFNLYYAFCIGLMNMFDTTIHV